MDGLQLEMSWQASLLSQRRKAGGPLGLKNLGNSCYLNSVLQCLTHTPPLANFCLRSLHSDTCDAVERKRECAFCIVEKRIARSLRSDSAADSPLKMRNCLRIFADHFRGGFQEDAHEFLRYVIDACHNTCLRLKKLRRKGCELVDGGTVVREIFGGALQSQVKCLSCNADSNKVDEIMDISLDVMHSYSVKEAMHKFFQPEVLDGNNKYKCENCKKLVAARKQMSILQAPNILVIQLKRFEGLYGKIDKAITFQEVLVLSSFMSKASKDPQPEYSLFGTIVHSGFSPESGHYYAYIKDATGRWFCCNDSYVSVANLNDVLSEKVYILFFSRTNRRPATVVSNGVKACCTNGNGAVNIKSASNTIENVPIRPPVGQSLSNGALKHKNATEDLDKIPREPLAEQSLRKDTPTLFKANKVLARQRIKININGNGSANGVLPTCSKSANTDSGMELNGHAKGLVCKEEFDDNKSLQANENGFNRYDKVRETNGDGFKKNDKVRETNGETCRPNAVKEEIGHDVQSGTAGAGASDISESNGLEARSHENEIQNGQANGHHTTAGSKRKGNKGACILLAEDPLARDDLKKVLEQETSSFLRSCGWYSDVYNFMKSRKRLCTEDSERNPSSDDLKKLLTADAKATFTSEIPETLKQRLIKLLSSISYDDEQLLRPSKGNDKGSQLV